MNVVLDRLIDFIPVLLFFTLYLIIEERKYQSRVRNAEALESRREVHEREMEAKRMAHDKDMNTLWASYIQQLVSEIKASHQIILQRIENHEAESEDRYEKMGITKDLVKVASQTLAQAHQVETRTLAPGAHSLAPDARTGVPRTQVPGSAGGAGEKP